MSVPVGGEQEPLDTSKCTKPEWRNRAGTEHASCIA